MSDYATIPAGATLDVKPFAAHVSDDKLQHFRKLLELSPVAPPVFENTNAGRKYGMTREWLNTAKQTWLNEFDWRKYEDRINSFPNFKTAVKDTAGNTIDVHFLALFSENPDAVPIAFLHGWPSSSCSFIDVLEMLKNKYSSKELPYHVVVPSLPGYTYSSNLPVDVDYGIEMAADAVHKLMTGLGFDSKYLVQGGDLGSFISRVLAMSQDACKGMHVNMMPPPQPPSGGIDSLTSEQKRVYQRASEFIDTSYAFALEQGSRPATVGLALSSSPLALLSWIGEKYLEWTDEDPPLEKILETVTLYWMTDTIPRCFYHNRALGGADDNPKVARISVIQSMSTLKLPYVEKPCGYSLFHNDIIPVPKTWAENSCNLISFNEHKSGGHFAAMEKPKQLLEDVEEFVKAWKATV